MNERKEGWKEGRKEGMNERKEGRNEGMRGRKMKNTYVIRPLAQLEMIII